MWNWDGIIWLDFFPPPRPPPDHLIKDSASSSRRDTPQSNYWGFISNNQITTNMQVISEGSILVWCPNCDPVPNSFKSKKLWWVWLDTPVDSAKFGSSLTTKWRLFGGLPNLKIKYHTVVDSKNRIISNLIFTLCAEHLFESRLVRLSFLLDKTSTEAVCHFNRTNKNYLKKLNMVKGQMGMFIQFLCQILHVFSSNKIMILWGEFQEMYFLRAFPGFLNENLLGQLHKL